MTRVEAGIGVQIMAIILVHVRGASFHFATRYRDQRSYKYRNFDRTLKILCRDPRVHRMHPQSCGFIPILAECWKWSVGPAGISMSFGDTRYSEVLSLSLSFHPLKVSSFL